VVSSNESNTNGDGRRKTACGADTEKLVVRGREGGGGKGKTLGLELPLQVCPLRFLCGEDKLFDLGLPAGDCVRAARGEKRGGHRRFDAIADETKAARLGGLSFRKWRKSRSGRCENHERTNDLPSCGGCKQISRLLRDYWTV
jgi:hypothetical protein